MDKKQDKMKGITMGKAILKLHAYAEEGLVTVQVLKARHLSSAYSEEPSHSFVEVSLQPDPHGSTLCRTAPRPDRHPVFNETFSFELLGEVDSRRRLYLSVWILPEVQPLDASNPLEFVGSMSFGLHHILAKDKTVQCWYYLLKDSVGRRKHLQAILNSAIYSESGEIPRPGMYTGMDDAEFIGPQSNPSDSGASSGIPGGHSGPQFNPRDSCAPSGIPSGQQCVIQAEVHNSERLPGFTATLPVSNDNGMYNLNSQAFGEAPPNMSYLEEDLDTYTTFVCTKMPIETNNNVISQPKLVDTDLNDDDEFRKHGITFGPSIKSVTQCTRECDDESSGDEKDYIKMHPPKSWQPGKQDKSTKSTKRPRKQVAFADFVNTHHIPCSPGINPCLDATRGMPCEGQCIGQCDSELARLDTHGYMSLSAVHREPENTYTLIRRHHKVDNSDVASEISECTYSRSLSKATRALFPHLQHTPQVTRKLLQSQQQNIPSQPHNNPPQQQNGPPHQQNGPPHQHNIPPQHHNNPPQQQNGPPHQQNGPPHQHNIPPQHHNNLTQQQNSTRQYGRKYAGQGDTRSSNSHVQGATHKLSQSQQHQTIPQQQHNPQQQKNQTEHRQQVHITQRDSYPSNNHVQCPQQAHTLSSTPQCTASHVESGEECAGWEQDLGRREREIREGRARQEEARRARQYQQLMLKHQQQIKSDLAQHELAKSGGQGVQGMQGPSGQPHTETTVNTKENYQQETHQNSKTISPAQFVRTGSSDRQTAVDVSKERYNTLTKRLQSKSVEDNLNGHSMPSVQTRIVVPGTPQPSRTSLEIEARLGSKSLDVLWPDNTLHNDSGIGDHESSPKSDGELSERALPLPEYRPAPAPPVPPYCTPRRVRRDVPPTTHTGPAYPPNQATGNMGTKPPLPAKQTSVPYRQKSQVVRRGELPANPTNPVNTCAIQVHDVPRWVREDKTRIVCSNDSCVEEPTHPSGGPQGAAMVSHTPSCPYHVCASCNGILPDFAVTHCDHNNVRNSLPQSHNIPNRTPLHNAHLQNKQVHIATMNTALNVCRAPTNSSHFPGAHLDNDEPTESDSQDGDRESEDDFGYMSLEKFNIYKDTVLQHNRTSNGLHCNDHQTTTKIYFL